MTGARFVIVSGPSGAGKSTLAPQLARGLGLPILAKDTVKEALMRSLGVSSIDDSRRMGGAAFEVLYALAAASPPGAVVEAVFHRTRAVDEVRALPGALVEVFCAVTREVALRRVRERTGRDPGHFDADRADHDLWNDEVACPIAGGWPVIEVDTSNPVDRSTLLDTVRDSFWSP